MKQKGPSLPPPTTQSGTVGNAADNLENAVLATRAFMELLQHEIGYPLGGTRTEKCNDTFGAGLAVIRFALDNKLSEASQQAIKAIHKGYRDELAAPVVASQSAAPR